MEDQRIWAFEESLWTGDEEHYRESIDEACLMVLPKPPFVISGPQAIDAVSATPRWSSIELSERHVSRPQEGLIVVAYTAHATKQGTEDYVAHCSSTYRRLEHDRWKVVQHQQTPRIDVKS